eukprot:TRINITY_DN49270_c0_g1_i1.p2 TRINITY_DN49270_c0_g1~~TRINITY_DN49270_c0_g1_i1.p2  ORF type:complete len:120 (-),score=9.80 TRINITY_DN49270_c0_g1_i1:501-860(-)
MKHWGETQQQCICIRPPTRRLSMTCQLTVVVLFLKIYMPALYEKLPGVKVGGEGKAPVHFFSSGHAYTWSHPTNKWFESGSMDELGGNSSPPPAQHQSVVSDLINYNTMKHKRHQGGDN